MTNSNDRHLMLFTYDFPYKKTQDFIFRLMLEGYHIDYIIAAPWQDLNLSSPSMRIKPRHTGLVHPKLIADYFKIPYKVYNHNSYETISYLKAHPVSFSIISGARILKKDVINAAQNKIINIHPGLIPETRGLDTLLWAISTNQPIGITAHFIDPSIDGGSVIYREKLKIYPDDTIIDISLRQLEKQTDILIKSLMFLRQGETKLQKVDTVNHPSRGKMSIELEKSTIKKFPAWREYFSEHE